MFDEFSLLLDAAATPALVWLATYLLHSSLLLGAAWGLSRLSALSAPATQDALWKTALVGGVVTASVFAGSGGWAEWAILPAEETVFLDDAAPVAFDSHDTVVLREDVAGGVTVWSTTRSAAPVATPLAEPAMPGFPMNPLSIPAALGLLWAFGALVEGLRRTRHHRRFLDALGVRARVSDGAAPLVLADLAERAGVRRPVRLTTSATLRSPVALDGWRRAEVCVPGAALALPDAELRALLAHEVAHLARRDPAWLGLFALVESVFWMQPMNRLARRGQQEAAETLCDGWAASQSAPTAMAGCLLQVAGWLRAPGGLRAYVVPSPLAVGMADRPSALRGRVERLLGENPNRLGRALPALAVGIALAALVAGTGFSQRAAWMPEVPDFDLEMASFELEPLDDLVVEPATVRLEAAQTIASRRAAANVAQEQRAASQAWSTSREWAASARSEEARRVAEAQREQEVARALRFAPQAQTVRVQSTSPSPQKREEIASRFAAFTLDATELGLAAASQALRELSESGELADMGLDVDLEDVLAEIDFDQLEAEATREMLAEMGGSVGTSRACAGSACASDHDRADHLREMQERHAEHAAQLERQAAEMERKAAELRSRLGSR